MIGMDDQLPAESVRLALDDLLIAVDKAADDLRAFHTVVSHKRVDPLPPFPRATMLLTSSVIEHLRKVEVELSEVLVALGLSHGKP